MTLEIAALKAHASELRARIIETSHKSGTPHLGGCLSSVDMLTALYFRIMNIDPDEPAKPSRDRFILSKGHGVPALYQVLARRGYFPVSLMDNYGEDDTQFGEHPPIPGKVPGIEAATGSLGHGMPMGVGMAMAARIKGEDFRVFVMVGDGECNEGSIWEAAMLAAAQKLNRLVVMVDFNGWQGTGRSTEILALTPLAEKWRAFGWHAIEIDGHDMTQVVAALEQAQSSNDQPVVIVAKTVKGKGVSFMEDDNNWHYRIPTADEVVAAKQELGVSA